MFKFARLFPRGRSLFILAVGLGLALLAQGCGGGGPDLARVSGKVTYKGAPLAKGTVTFVSKSGGRNATGQIQSDGTYRLQTIDPNDGAIVGDYDVTVYSREDEAVLDYIPTKPIPPKFLAPEKYEKPTTSGLTASVKSGTNSFNFDLVD